MNPVTKEILKGFETMSRRFKLVETRLDRLENRVFTPAENTRFYEEMAAELTDAVDRSGGGEETAMKRH